MACFGRIIGLFWENHWLVLEEPLACSGRTIGMFWAGVGRRGKLLKTSLPAVSRHRESPNTRPARFVKPGRSTESLTNRQRCIEAAAAQAAGVQHGPHFQGVVAGGQAGRDQEHQLGVGVFAHHLNPDLITLAAAKKDALRSVGGIELELVAGQLAHAAGGQAAVALAAVQIGVLQRARADFAGRLFLGLGVDLDGPAKLRAGAGGRFNPVAAGDEAVRLAVKVAFNAHAAVDQRRVDPEAVQQQPFDNGEEVHEHGVGVGLGRGRTAGDHALDDVVHGDGAAGLDNGPVVVGPVGEGVAV